LVVAISFLGLVIFLHRIARPLGFALMACAMRATGERFSSLIKLAKGGTTLFATTDESVKAAVSAHGFSEGDQHSAPDAD
jgi:hypothetical protein